MGVEYEVQASKFNLSINGRFGSVFLVQFWAPLRGKEENKNYRYKSEQKRHPKWVSFFREPSRTSWKMWTFYRDLAVSDQVTLTNEGDVPKEKKSLGLGLGETDGLPEIGPWNKTPVTSSLSLYAVTLYKYKKCGIGESNSSGQLGKLVPSR